MSDSNISVRCGYILKAFYKKNLDVSEVAEQAWA